ncbi:MAG: hypothetical protein OXD39_00505, partial [Gemmatimonadetes bacterium]|nr:hypothetical protein [Gemmatimonadota bacterium]
MTFIYTLLFSALTVLLSPILVFLSILDRLGMRQRLGQRPLVPDGGHGPVAPDGGQRPLVPDGGHGPVAPDGGQRPLVPDGGHGPVAPDGGQWPLVPDGGHRPVVWFHCASVGEATGLAAVIGAFVKRHPGFSVLVTTMTETGLAYARKHVPQARFYGLAPLDAPFIVHRVFGRVR